MYDRFWKRLIDVVSAALLLAVSAWLFVLIILVYYFGIRGSIFFVQERIGKNERVFKIIKFRTLKSGPGTPVQRKFGWGNFLRRTSLDELPQLFNVLKGEMSLIGPRPLPAEYLTLFSEKQRRRHLVKPGITGLTQVNGRVSIPWEEKFKLDLYYVDHLSFLLDLKIIIKTIILLFKFKRDTSLTEKPFTGNA